MGKLRQITGKLRKITHNQITSQKTYLFLNPRYAIYIFGYAELRVTYDYDPK